MTAGNFFGPLTPTPSGRNRSAASVTPSGIGMRTLRSSSTRYGGSTLPGTVAAYSSARLRRSGEGEGMRGASRFVVGAGPANRRGGGGGASGAPGGGGGAAPGARGAH